KVACTFTASRMESPASTQSAVTRCGRFVSYAGITRETPTCSFPNVVGRSAPSASIASSSVSGRPPRCHSRSTHTCFAMPVGSSSPTMATTRGPCSTTSGTKTFNTRSGTPKWLRTASKTFGGTDNGKSRIAPRSRVTSARSRARGRWLLAVPRLALPRADRGVGVLQRPVRTLAPRLLKLGWTQHSNGFRSALDDRSARRSPALQHLLNEVDARLYLFVRPVLQRIAVLDLVLARDQQSKDLEICRRLRAAHFRNRLLPVLAEIAQQRANDLLHRARPLGE